MKMMNKNDWWKDAVVYQIYPQSFKDSNNDGIGDINGIREKIPYLKDLGVNVLWLNPIYESPMVDNGYDISDYYKIADCYGTMEDFENLLKEAHDAGIKIIMDLAVCASSIEHKWFKESKKSRDNKYSDYYIWKDPKEDGSAPNNWGSIFGSGSAWEYVEERGQYYLHLFAVEQPDLNWENPDLRNEVYENMEFWLKKGIDGFRLDSISLISKKQDFPDDPTTGENGYGSPYFGASNGPRVHEFLQEMYEKVLSKYDVMTVGEATRTPVDKALLYCQPERKELNMVFQFDHMHVDYGKFGRYSDLKFKLSDLKEAMFLWQKSLNGVGWNSLYWDNHDQPRFVSRFGNDDSKYRKLSATMLATVLFFQQGTPFIYQGDEIGMTNVAFDSIDSYKDIEAHNMYLKFSNMGLSNDEIMSYIHNKSRDNARTPMQWNSNLFAGFSCVDPWIELNPNYSKINVENDMNSDFSIHDYYKKLIKYRKGNEIVRDGDFKEIGLEDSDIFSYTRTYKGKTLLVLGSFSDKKVCYNVPNNLQKFKRELVISNYDGNIEQNKDASTLYLRPYEALVFYMY
ncbi:glycoside hydrolase family 13 protein [Faecalicoccus pleomorphus]|uniref:glycoside hydrolase family 13 protein n=2 Tax=Faecalicoccus pleomorphus TaxID=1323 RepID=UPI00196019C0|nr:alpha-glucosidase [Faecalicoccus pleomorphus]